MENLRRQLDDMNMKIEQLEKRLEELTKGKPHPETAELESDVAALRDKIAEAHKERRLLRRKLGLEKGRESEAPVSEYEPRR